MEKRNYEDFSPFGREKGPFQIQTSTHILKVQEQIFKEKKINMFASTRLSTYMYVVGGHSVEISLYFCHADFT